MNTKKFLSLALSTIMMALVLIGCQKTTQTNEPAASAEETANIASDPSKIKGEITFVNHRTDLMNGGWKDYAKKFNEKYPNIKVTFEAMKDYQGEITIRMNSENYGDVLLIPEKLKESDMPSFFIPLGKKSELDKKYDFISDRYIGDDVYAIPIAANCSGIVYNKKVFEKAGITSIPKTPEEFISAMKLIKEKTDAIPLYTNYHDNWPLAQWEQYRVSVAGDADFVNRILPHDKEPFAQGKPHYIVYKLMYDLIKEGLVEEDPMTTDWESSKGMIARGEIATMALGSWAVAQIKDLADIPEDISYMPFPYSKDGKMYSNASGDMKICVNKNSKNIEAAKAWVWWFLNESNYAVNNDMIPIFKGSEYPDILNDFQNIGVEMIIDNGPKEGEAGWIDAINKESEVGLWNENFKKDIVETALGNKGEGTFDDIMNDLNKKWSNARKKLIKEGKIEE